ncbi:MAG: Autophagy protein 7 [Bogoriella megaspora]|nr:MAG: Autophagy protein 7 [Bogoriella megaspora]
MATIQYTPWTSDIELSFFSQLAALKLNHDGLDDSARKVLGLYEIRPGDAPERSCRMQIHSNALTTDELVNLGIESSHYMRYKPRLTTDSIQTGFYRAEGIIKNVNTIEQYKSFHGPTIIERAGHTIWDAIQDGTIYSCPSLLASFTAISFADLKKYRFTYHFAFPAIHSDPPWKSTGDEGVAVKKLAPTETTGLVDTVQTWKYGVDSRQHGFFLAKRIRNLPVDTKSSTKEGNEQEGESQTPITPTAKEHGYLWSVGSLSSYENGFFKDTEEEDRFVCFVDPSTYPKNPGWMLRNLLVLVKQRWKLEKVQVLCYRDTHLKRDQSNSIILNLQSTGAPSEETTSKDTPIPKVTGWERDENNRLRNRMVDLAAFMDPIRLADQAVDLNLKLIKWRIAPSLDLDVVKNTSCLLLGAGTLGSYVARNLMGWGVKKITFVDNATVSFSNPVRQPLFDFKDCLDGGAKKAYRAAEALAEIYPGVEANGHVMSVPMAGHQILDEKTVKSEFEKLKDLINEHDVIFMLMDTRESRWLPTVMGKSSNKIVVNAALGFDTFLVMRHGLRATKTGHEELGCYFCNDVVAPADSVKDQTLDQQCTVTRPGIAAIASALLVELLVSILQHPLKGRAPATTDKQSATAPATAPDLPADTMSYRPHQPPAVSPHSPPPAGSKSQSEAQTPAVQTRIGESQEVTQGSAPPPLSRPPSLSVMDINRAFKHPLGILPHTIRGFLSNFSSVPFIGRPYDCCSACSPKILRAYDKDGWEFVKRALNEKGYVEEVSGLAEVQRKAEEAIKGMEMEDDDDPEALDEEGELL